MKNAFKHMYIFMNCYIKFMFTFEVRINGALIAHIYGQNTDQIDDDGRTIYKYEYYEVSTRNVKRGTVLHKIEDKIIPLLSAILKDIQK